MGHQDKTVKLGRTKSHREAMLSNMAMSLLQHRVIRTTDAKAKALRPVVDRLIATTKQNTLASKRRVAQTIHVREVFQKLYTEIIPQFADRDSGFCRVIKLGVRRGDGAEMSVVELLTAKPAEEEKEKGKKIDTAVNLKTKLTSRLRRPSRKAATKKTSGTKAAKAKSAGTTKESKADIRKKASEKPEPEA